VGSHWFRRCRTDRGNSDFVPPTTWLGAGLALAVMAGAIFSHLTILGIVVMDDGGLLFGLALAVAVCSVVLLFLQRRRLPLIGAYL
jgi:putative oxidoreductase